VAQRLRDRLRPVAAAHGATIQVVEVPPGPPVLQTLVAEVYGPDPDARLALARQVKGTFEATPGVVDVDWYVESERPIWRLEVDADKAAAAGVSAADVAAVVGLAGAGTRAGWLHDVHAREDIPIVLRLPRERRDSVAALGGIRIQGHSGVALGDITRPVPGVEAPSLYRKNLQPVTYVTGDVAGEVESPVYAILQMNDPIGRLRGPHGRPIEIFNTVQPADSGAYALKWDGEWHITYEVFRDLGFAFAVVLVLI
jgi:multidrug efflux pump subunit AcrB